MAECKCLVCGRSLEGTNRRKYCSDKCSDKASKEKISSWKNKARKEERQQNVVREKRRPARSEKKMSLTEIAIAARKAGMSYGQYVGHMGL